MYENLEAEIARAGITKREIAVFLEIHENTLAYKMARGSFTIEEAFKIKHKFFQIASLNISSIVKRQHNHFRHRTGCREQYQKNLIKT